MWFKKDKKPQLHKAIVMHSPLPIQQQNRIYEAAVKAAEIESYEVKFLAAYYFRLGAEWAITEAQSGGA